MAREIITIECTEARKEGKSPSRYTTTRNKKLKTEKLEIKKYNPASAPPHAPSRNQVIMPRKTHTDKPERRGHAPRPDGNPHAPARSPKLISPWTRSISRTSTCSSSL